MSTRPDKSGSASVQGHRTYAAPGTILSRGAQSLVCTRPDKSGSASVQGHRSYAAPGTILSQRRAKLGKCHDVALEPLARPLPRHSPRGHTVGVHK